MLCEPLGNCGSVSLFHFVVFGGHFIFGLSKRGYWHCQYLIFFLSRCKNVFEEQNKKESEQTAYNYPQHGLPKFVETEHIEHVEEKVVYKNHQ
jgi:hypothetical protein